MYHAPPGFLGFRKVYHPMLVQTYSKIAPDRCIQLWIFVGSGSVEVPGDSIRDQTWSPIVGGHVYNHFKGHGKPFQKGHDRRIASFDKGDYI